ncbi:hypothetical protein JAAN108728_01735 [Janibacter anophelis]
MALASGDRVGSEIGYVPHSDTFPNDSEQARTIANTLVAG